MADPSLSPTGSLIPPDYRLRIPGPTAVPERVRQAMALPVLSHRGPEFRAVLADCVDMLRGVAGTAGDVFLFGGSGTAGMEAALANVLSPGDAILVLVNGQFGERFVSIAESLDAQVDSVVVPWGEAPDVVEVAARLKARTYRAVACVHNESATGVVTDIAGIGALLSDTDTLLIVDSVSGLAGIEVCMDDWGIDILVGASQKALMSPPGLTVLAVSEKAMRAVGAAKSRRFFFDLRKAKASSLKGETAFTPPVSLVLALREALAMIHGEGLTNVLKRHRRMSEALQAGCVALGLPMLPAPELRSATVTVAMVPEGLEGSAIVRHMYTHYHTVIAGQRTKLANRVIRFGTMGAIDTQDILTDLEQLEATLRHLGQSIAPGAGVAAAKACLSAVTALP
ncbi:MAG: pyridoxal-phosphate-dependent aminotransferase family protein [Pseudolabrys sp.]